jgi:hypothetical protein
VWLVLLSLETPGLRDFLLLLDAERERDRERDLDSDVDLETVLGLPRGLA